MRTPRLLNSKLAGLTRGIARELGKFGVVGVIAFVVDVGGFNLLRFGGGGGPLYDWPLAAKVLSAGASMIVSWGGNRYWTFRAHRRTERHLEFALFVVVCGFGTLIATSCLAFSHYVLGLQSALADNISANVVGLALATAFRFWAYRTYVFNNGRSGRQMRWGVDGDRTRNPVEVPESAS